METEAQLRALERELKSLKTEVNILDPSGGAVTRASAAAAADDSGSNGNGNAAQQREEPPAFPAYSSSKIPKPKLSEAEAPMVSLVAGDLIWLRSEGL